MNKTLYNWLQVPQIGMGMWQVSPDNALEAVKYGLEIGYRHIDTARIYWNENQVWAAVRDSWISREEIFITTKLWNSDQWYDRTLFAFEDSLKRLWFEYIDLFLIHWPVWGLRIASWKALERIYNDGRVKAIWVSNYTIIHLEEMKSYVDIMPMVNQVEFHPFLFQKSLLDYCENNKILLEGYAPLVRWEKMDNQLLLELWNKYSKTPAQILLRWSMQHGVVPLPKSITMQRLRENISIYDFEISCQDMERLDHLNINYRTCWDPTDIK